MATSVVGTGHMLSEDDVLDGLGSIGPTAGKSFGSVAYRTLNVKSKSITSLEVLEPANSSYHRHIQDLNAEHNRLENNSCSPLRHFSQLRSLNLSYNCLGSLFLLNFNTPVSGGDGLEPSFPCPSRLEELILSHNRIGSVFLDQSTGGGRPLARYPSLRRVLLNNNLINSVEADGVLSLLQHTSTLTCLNLGYNKLHSMDVAKLGSLGRGLNVLRELRLENNKLQDLMCLKALWAPSLTFLDVSRNKITSLKGFDAGKFPLLTKLHIRENKVSAIREAENLRDLPQLCELDLRLNPVIDSSSFYRVRVLYILPRLRHLDGREVSSQEKTDAQSQHGVDRGARLAVRSYLLPQENRTTPHSWFQTRNLASPNELYFHAHAHKGTSCHQMVHISAEEYWNMMSERGFVSAWSQYFELVQRAEPQELNFAGISLGHVGLWVASVVVEENPCISSLNLSGVLSGNHTHRWSSRVSAPSHFGLAALCDVLASPTSTISTLNLSRCGLTFSHAQLLCRVISASKSLAHLNISHNQLGDHVSEPLPEEHLTPIVPMDRAEQSSLSPRFHSVDEHMRSVIITACPGLHLIFGAVQDSTSLMSLDLSFNNIDDNGVRVIAAALVPQDSGVKANAKEPLLDPSLVLPEKHTSNSFGATSCLIRKLLLTGNPMGSAGGALLATALRHNTRIEVLGLSGNTFVTPVGETRPKAVTRITSEAVAELGHCLVQWNRSITFLDLNHIHLGQTAVESLARALQEDHCVLRRIDMSFCGLSSESLETFADALSYHSHQQRVLRLEQWDMSYNPCVSSRSVQAFLAAIASNTPLKQSLRHLYLEGLPLSYGSAQILSTLLENSVVQVLSLGAGVPVLVASECDEEEKEQRRLAGMMPPLSRDSGRAIARALHLGKALTQVTFNVPISAEPHAPITDNDDDEEDHQEPLGITDTLKEMGEILKSHQCLRKLGVRFVEVTMTVEEELKSQQNSAAVAIQAGYRGYRTRRRLSAGMDMAESIAQEESKRVTWKSSQHPSKRITSELAEDLADTTGVRDTMEESIIHHSRSKSSGAQENAVLDENHAAVLIQSQYRGFKTRKQYNLARPTRTPSLSMSGGARAPSTPKRASARSDVPVDLSRFEIPEASYSMENLSEQAVLYAETSLESLQAVDEEDAAAKIQAVFRGHEQRKRIEEQEKAAAKIQSTFRMMHTRRQYTQDYNTKYRQQLEASLTIIHIKAFEAIEKSLLSSHADALAIQGGRITRESLPGLQRLVRSAAMGGNVSVLDLSESRLGDEGAGAVAVGLTANKTLSSLNLRNCSLGSAIPSGLRATDMAWEPCKRPDGLLALLNTLQQDRRIMSVNLSKNQLGSDAIALVCRVMSSNESVTSLDLSENSVPLDTFKELGEFLGKNTCLRILRLPRLLGTDGEEEEEESAPPQASGRQRRFSITLNGVAELDLLGDLPVGEQRASVRDHSTAVAHVVAGLWRNHALQELYFDFPQNIALSATQRKSIVDAIAKGGHCTLQTVGTCQDRHQVTGHVAARKTDLSLPEVLETEHLEDLTDNLLAVQLSTARLSHSERQ